MADVNEYYSHPDKKLVDHISGVVKKVKACCNLEIAERAAIFHDAGKLNHNFQARINPNLKNDSQGINFYSNHSYLSGYIFLCYCFANEKEILTLFGKEREWLASILAIIVSHHGNLPDFPEIFKSQEYQNLLGFIENNPKLPARDLLGHFINSEEYSVLDNRFRDKFINFPYHLAKSITNPLDFFLETQFAFASVINADKSDASDYQANIESIRNFCNKYQKEFNAYFKKLPKHSELNKIRCQMNEEANVNINKYLSQGRRVFSLTAPTGAGKTIMLLSLAGEILKQRGSLRIIYALPFLSITEQVEEVCNDIFKRYKDLIRRIDSKTENEHFEKSQKRLEHDPTAFKEIIDMQFAEDTFDYPFIITTFVRLFETLVSNRNATLLKLPRFTNTIFLIDEIQSLPPRLYGFFVALLEAFCRKFNSYAVISTATMPNFKLPDNNKHDLNMFFRGYSIPPELLSEKYFYNQVFNRYSINRVIDPININELADLIYQENSSILVILNTIKDTKNLYKLLEKKDLNVKLELLNTHFTPEDRKKKINDTKRILRKSEKVILISTQLIEAGVDIDFPIVYRDICPIPNVIQTAGRCNRQGKGKHKGKVILFELQENGYSRSKLIYRGRDLRFLNFAKEKIVNGAEVHEPDLFEIQKSFFDDLNMNTIFGVHYIKNKEIDFIQKIKEAAFEQIGKFRLIAERDFGKEYRYYIPSKVDDNLFERLEEMLGELKKIDFKNYEARKLMAIQVDNHLKKMADRIINIRISDNDVKPVASSDQCCGIYKLPINFDDGDKIYNYEKGISLSSVNQVI